MLELERSLLPNEPRAPDAPGELADAVSALRLATAAPVAAGPVLFERLDWRPLAIRPMLPIAATEPSGEPTRLDSFRARLASDLLARLGRAEEDPELAEALDRWELSLFADEPFRSEQLREALAALLGGPDGFWAASVRAAVLLGETGRDRAEQLERLRGLARGETAGAAAADAVRKAVVETLAHGDRAGLVATLDDALRRRPAASGRLLRCARLLEGRRTVEPPGRGSTVVPGHGVACESGRLEGVRPAERLVAVMDAQRQALVRAGPLEPEDLDQLVRVDLVSVSSPGPTSRTRADPSRRTPRTVTVRPVLLCSRSVTVVFGPVSTRTFARTMPTIAAIPAKDTDSDPELDAAREHEPGVLGRRLEVREGIGPSASELPCPAAALLPQVLLGRVGEVLAPDPDPVVRGVDERRHVEHVLEAFGVESPRVALARAVEALQGAAGVAAVDRGTSLAEVAVGSGPWLGRNRSPFGTIRTHTRASWTATFG